MKKVSKKNNILKANVLLEFRQYLSNMNEDYVQKMLGGEFEEYFKDVIKLIIKQEMGNEKLIDIKSNPNYIQFIKLSFERGDEPQKTAQSILDTLR